MEDTQDDARVGEAALLEVMSLLPAALLQEDVADVAALRAVSRRVRAHAAVHDRWRDAAAARRVLDALMARHERDEVSWRELSPLRAVCRAWSDRIGSSQSYQASLLAYSSLAVLLMQTGDAAPPPHPHPPAAG